MKKTKRTQNVGDLSRPKGEASLLRFHFPGPKGCPHFCHSCPPQPWRRRTPFTFLLFVKTKPFLHQSV
jgi:hypothetical protein